MSGAEDTTGWTIDTLYRHTQQQLTDLRALIDDRATTRTCDAQARRFDSADLAILTSLILLVLSVALVVTAVAGL